MKLLKKILIILLCMAVLLIAVFLIGRYGWKLGGFHACETAGIEQVNVEEGHIRIRGFYPGSFPRGFLGYHAEQVDHTLYVGFKFSGLFGIYETGDFDVTIPTKGTVTQIVVKSGEHEYTVWPQENEFFVNEAEATENGSYVRLERDDTETVPGNATEVIYEGEYASYDIEEPMLFIQKNADGTYRIQIGIYRLIQLDKCVGVDNGDRLEFSTVELGENQKITGTIILNGEVATVTLYAPWSDTWFKDVNEYNYYRVNKEVVQ